MAKQWIQKKKFLKQIIDGGGGCGKKDGRGGPGTNSRASTKVGGIRISGSPEGLKDIIKSII